MASPKVIPLFKQLRDDTQFEQLIATVEGGPAGKVITKPRCIGRALMLSYKTGDRCIRCGNGAFHVGRVTATCANPRCELPVPLG